MFFVGGSCTICSNVSVLFEDLYVLVVGLALVSLRSQISQSVLKLHLCWQNLVSQDLCHCNQASKLSMFSICRNGKARGGSTPPPAYEEAVQTDVHDDDRLNLNFLSRPLTCNFSIMNLVLLLPVLVEKMHDVHYICWFFRA